VSRFWILIYIFVVFLSKSPTTQVILFSPYSLLKYSDKLPTLTAALALAFACYCVAWKSLAEIGLLPVQVLQRGLCEEGQY